MSAPAPRPEPGTSVITVALWPAESTVPKLVKLALDEKLTGEEIKKRVQSWRPDTFRV